jgi:DMSO/TMAO reductase YedYZ molybdopterin-dependent catalytic subunit
VSEATHEPDQRELELRAQARNGPAIPVEEFTRRSRRSFLTGAAGILGAGLLWRWVQTQDTDDGIPGVLRDTLEVNEGIWSNVQGRSAPEYAIGDASPIQVNGRVGIRDELDAASWTVRVEGPGGEQLDELDLAAFEAMDQTDLVYEHKCIEGWSNITHWGGVRFRDFHERYADRIGDASYVALETPDGEYYVGWDLSAILHPQTILALREHDEPLDQDHGAPLRLASPNKYGIKCLKRIGVIRYTDERPADYWAERSYDWYAGL